MIILFSRTDTVIPFRMRNFFPASILFFVCLCFAQSAQSATSEWQDLGGGKARLLAVLDPQTKRVDAAVEVKLESGWSTYWRYPGSSGIPPIFDFSRSKGFIADKIHFPTPTLISPNNNPYAGYKKGVIFPIEGLLDTAQKARIDLQLLIGVCAIVCIPAQAKFLIELQDLFHSDPLATQMINLSKSSVPMHQEGNEMLLGKSVSEDGALHITVAHTEENRKPTLFVEGPHDWYLTPARLVETVNGKAIFSLDISRAPKDADIMATQLTYTLSRNGHGIEFTD